VFTVQCVHTMHSVLNFCHKASIRLVIFNDKSMIQEEIQIQCSLHSVVISYCVATSTMANILFHARLVWML
jgi:hypothetical protein